MMNSPSLPMDVRDINVCLLSAKKKRSTSSPALKDLDQMSLCNFPSSLSISEDLSAAAQTSGGRKRRYPDYDTQSVDITFREPLTKKIRRPLAKVSSIANLIKESPLRQAKNTLKRSLSFSRDPPNSPASKYRLPGTPKHYYTVRRKKSAASKPHIPQNWVEAVGPDAASRFSKEEVKRQEALYSIFKTESELVEDLRMVINIFFHPMLRLSLISEEDHCKIFGSIQTILTLHEDLVSKLQELRTGGECMEGIGDTILQWSHSLAPYADYCANLVMAKYTLEAQKKHPAVGDFLQRCLDSEFSRKIDLWTFLDSPRTRIMKYPILLKEVKKKTPAGHADHEHLDQAIASFDALIKVADQRTGIAKCLDVISRLDYLHDDQKCPAIQESQFILCSGVLRNKNGSKLHAFLFDKAFVLTRPTSRTSTLTYQVYRQPIPINHLVVEDLTDGEAKIGGSFRGTLKANTTTGCKFLFKISCSDPHVSRHSHTLQANGDFDKKAWMDTFKTVVPTIVRVGGSRVTTV